MRCKFQIHLPQLITANGAARSLLFASVSWLAITLPQQAQAEGFRSVPHPGILVLAQNETAQATEQPATGSRAEDLKRALADIRRRLAEQREQRSQQGRDLVADELKIAREEIASLTTSLTDVRAQRDGLLAELTNARADLNALRSQLAQSEAERAKTQEASIAISNELEGQVSQLSEASQGLQAENDELASLLEAANARLDTVRQSLSAAYNERDQLRASLNLASADADGLNSELTTLQTERDELAKELAGVREERDGLTQQVASLRNDVATASAGREQVLAQLAEFRTAASAQTLELENDFAQQLEIAQNRAAQLGIELEALREVAGASIIEVRDLGEQLLTSISENEELAAAVGELRATKKLLSDELDAARRDVQIYAAEAATLRQQTMSVTTGSAADGASGNNGLADTGTESNDEELPQLVALQNDDGSEPSAAANDETLPALSSDDAQLAPQLQASLSDLNAIETPDGWLMTIPEGIDFAPGSDQLQANTSGVLGQVAALINSYGPNAVRIVGHTDSNGEASVNQDLSERRAESVKQFLVDNHALSDDLIVTQGFGESRPIASNASPEGRSANRRVEVYLRR